MTWDAMAAIAELLGAIGVIASLVYLAGQMKSSADQARQAAIQSVVNQMNNVWTQTSGNREQADLWVRGSQGTSHLRDETDGVQFSALMLCLFRPYEEIFHYWRDGRVDDWMWESISQQCEDLMVTPGFAEWWERRGAWFSTSFQEHVRETAGHASSYRRWGGSPSGGAS